MKKSLLLALFMCTLSILNIGNAYDGETGPPTVTSLNLDRYVGTWYEVARLPNRFQRGCLGVKAEYKQRDDGKIIVINSCKREKQPEEIKQSKGLAKVVDTKTNSKLKVTFTPFLGFLFSGDYWVLKLDQDYRYALVGSPDYKYLWVLSRTTTLPDELIESLLDDAKTLGYDISDIIKTPTWK